MSLLKNSTIVVTGVVVSNLLAYVFHFIAGRMLGPEEYGEFGALMALFLMAGLPASAIGFAVTKFTSRFQAENTPEIIALLRKKIQNGVLVFSAIMLIIVIIFSKLITSFLKIDSNYPVIIVGISIVFVLLLPVNRGILQGLKKFRILSWNAILESIFRVLLLISFLYFGYGVNGAILSYGLAYFIAFLLIFPFIKEIKIQGRISEKMKIGTVYWFAFQVILVNILIQTIINVPLLIIKHFFSSEFTGYWTAALNITRISLFVTGSISIVMFPAVVEEKSIIKKRKILIKAAILVFVSSLMMAILFFSIPQFLIQILYGPNYIGAAPIIRWMGFAMIFIGLLQLRADYFLAKMK